jgi:hypothetical protein
VEEPTLFLDEVKRVIAISLDSLAVVYYLTSVSIKHSPCSILHCKSLSEPFA